MTSKWTDKDGFGCVKDYFMHDSGACQHCGSLTALCVTQSHEDSTIVAMARSVRDPQLRHRLALAKGIGCRWHGNDGHCQDDGVWKVPVQLGSSLLERSKQEQADGNLAGSQAEDKSTLKLR